MFVTGIVFIPVGAIVAITGGVFLAASNATAVSNEDSGFGSSSENSISDSTSTTAGAVLAVGGLMLVGGIVMTVVGGKKVPVDPGAALLDPRHSPPTPRASVTPLFGPVSGVRVQF